MNSNLYSIFPTPIYTSSVYFEFNQKHFEVLSSLEKVRNSHNSFSRNTYILELDIFKELKKEIQNHLNQYLVSVHNPKDNIELKLTQSWINWTENSESHHDHAHPNSFVSGVLYIQSNSNDKISFKKEGYSQFQLNPKEYNNFNSDSWWFPAKESSIIIFPSSVVHSVDTRMGDKTRISLAFNSFLKGFLGEELSSLYELKL